MGNIRALSTGIMVFRLFEAQWAEIKADWKATRDEGSVSAIGRFVMRAAVLVFLAAFKWTIPLAVFFLLRIFGGV